MLSLRYSLSSIALFASMAASAQQSGGPTAVAETDDEAANRYAVEIILFTYDQSISAGTEVFVPETPPITPLDDFSTDALMQSDRRSDGIPNPDPAVPGRDAPGSVGLDTTDRSDMLRADDATDGFGDAEQPDDASAPIDVDSPLDLIVTGTTRIEYTPLPPEARTLTDAHEKLLSLDAYEPVLWTGWTQLVLEENQSPALDLRRLGDLPLGFDGELKLYVGRFVHLVVDVSLEASNRPPAARPRSDANVAGDTGRFRDPYARRAPQPIIYRISEDRIMRNGETRYFDHPRFGLIARLSLVEAPDPDDDEARFLPDLLPGTVDPEPGNDPGI